MNDSMAAESQIGLVVLNYNNTDETLRFLDAVRGMESIASIQVIDNASTDDSFNRLMEYCTVYGQSKIMLCSASHNEGYATGNNLGVRELLQHACCSYVLIANPDTLFSETTVLYMLRYLIDHSEYAAAAPLMTDSLGRECLSAWKLPSRTTFLIDLFRLLFPFIRNPLDYGKSLNTHLPSCSVEVLPGSLFLIRADVFLGVGGFDEDTFLYGEENLLFAKIQSYGMKCALLPQCSYIHAHGTSIKKEFSSVRKRYLMLLDSNVVYCKKVLGASRLSITIYKLLFRLFSWVISIAVTCKNIFLRYWGTANKVIREER